MTGLVVVRAWFSAARYPHLVALIVSTCRYSGAAREPRRSACFELVEPSRSPKARLYVSPELRAVRFSPEVRCDRTFCQLGVLPKVANRSFGGSSRMSAIDLPSMSSEELWSLRQSISKVLTKRLTTEQRRLEARLAALQQRSVGMLSESNSIASPTSSQKKFTVQKMNASAARPRSHASRPQGSI